MKNKVRALLFGTLALFPVLEGCSSGDRSEGRLLDSDPSGYDLTAEEERLRKMQMLRYIVDSTGKESELTVSEFVSGFANAFCPFGGSPRLTQTAEQNWRGCSGGLTIDSCGTFLGCAVETQCLSDVLRTFASVSTSTQVTDTAGNTYSVPAQSEATRAALFEHVAYFEGWRMESARAFLNKEAFPTYFPLPYYPPECTNYEALSVADIIEENTNETEMWEPYASMTSTAAGDFMANQFLEAYWGAHDALEQATQAHLAVAASQRGSSPDEDLSSKRAQSGSSLSRAKASHIITGGIDGLEGDVENPLCSVGSLTAQEDAALEIFRKVGIPPSAILNDQLSIENLVDSTAGQVTDGSVRQRLEYFENPMPQSVVETYGLTYGDFAAARRYLKQEIKAFARSLDAKVWVHPTGQTGFDKFAGTTTPPGAPDVYWMALALTDRSLSDTTQTGGRGWSTFDFGDFERAPTWPINDRAPTMAEVLHFGSLSASALAAEQADVYAPLAAVNQTLRVGRGYEGEILQCDNYENNTQLHVRIADQSVDAGRLYFYAGEDALRCAVSGTIEGAPCTSTFLASKKIGLYAPLSVEPGSLEDDWEGQWVTSGYFAQNSVNSRVYLVEAENDAPVPGQFRALAGIRPYREEPVGTLGSNCRSIPFGAEIRERVTAALAPNPDHCTLPRVECADAFFDERLPLENELSEDGDGIESSWRHYLNLAKQAANESDLLAQQYIDSEVSVEEAETGQNDKAIGALEELQSICGTAADVGILLEKLQGANGARTLGSCPTTIPAGHQCVGGILVKDLGATLSGDPELEELWKCINDSNQPLEWMHLGGAEGSEEDVTLCAWEDAAGEVLCSGAEEAGVQCPRVVLKEEGYESSSAVCTDWLEEIEKDAHPVGLSPEEGLGFFDTLATLPAERPENVCDQIRQLRKSPQDGALITRIVESGIFTKTRMSEERKRLRLEGSYGGYLKLLLDEDTMISTGQSLTGITAPTAWPCVASDNEKCGVSQDGLFCEQIDCSSYSSVQDFSGRVARATAAALAISYSETGALDCDEVLEDVLLPWHNDYLRCLLDEQGGNDTIRSFELPVYLHEELTIKGGEEQIRNLQFVRDPEDPEDATDDGEQAFAANPIPVTLWFGPRGMKVLDTQEVTVPYVFDLSSGATSDPYLRSEEIPSGGGIVYYPAFISRGLSGLKPSNFDFFLGGLGDGKGGALLQLLTGERHSDVTVEGESIASRKVPSLDLPFGEPSTSETVLPSCTLDPSGPSCIDDFTCGKPGCGQSRTNVLRENASEARSFWMRAYGLGKQKGAPSYAFDYEETPVERLDDFEKDAFSKEALLDGLELLCEAAAGVRTCGAPPEVTGVGDLGEVGAFMECEGDSILQQAATTVFKDFPNEAVDAIHSGGAVDSAGGTLAEAYSNLRLALHDIASAGPAIGRTVRQLGYDMTELHQQMIRLGLRKKMSGINYQAQVANQVTNCISAASAGSLDPVGSATSGVRATAVCANSLIQSRLADKLRDLQDEENSSEIESALNDFNRKMDATSSALEEQQLMLSSAIENVGKQLGIIESERSKAGRALNRALWYLSDEGSAVDAKEAHRDLGRIRYENAHLRAKKLAFLAKRAIEQRIGVKLSDIREELPLVESPRSWESTVCETSPLNFERLKEAATDEELQTFANSFIGEYVAKLENLVESYRLEYGFKEGSDTAVVSLRDDVIHAREACLVDGPNLLVHSSRLHRTGIGSPELGEWGVDGCTPDGEGDFPKCASIQVAQTMVNMQSVPHKPFTSAATLNEVQGYSIAFGGGLGTGCTGCSWNQDVVVGQHVHLEPGIYRFSWHSPQATTGFENSGTALIDGVVAAKVNEGYIAPTELTWGRYHFTFEVDEASDVLVGFTSPDNTDTTITVGAPMLERVGTSGDVPGVYVDTANTTQVELKVCPDLDGDEFRTRWTRGCDLLCADGYASDCRGHAKKACYWETSFHMTQRAIEAGEQFASAGFAKGNFNYRLDRVALNFVGTGLRDCSNSLSPETCYGSGFLPYSLEHSGPFYVRNHFGNDYKAHLFNGVVEHARGLGAERYISNPIASSDRDQLEQFTRLEMQGRPLDGSFTLRVWDEPGVNFDALQDVQLVLDYRYWTRN